MKNLPVYDININNLIKNYYNLYFKYKFLGGGRHKYMSNR